MVKVYDKVQWHLDGGEDKNEVLNKFFKIFTFLLKHKMLNSEGLEMAEEGIDSSVSLNEQILSDEGKKFLNACYDNVLECNSFNISNELEKEYNKFLK